MAKTKKKDSRLQFHLLKTGSYSTFHVDGVWGGMTPSGGIYVDFFVERFPIPTSVYYEVNPNGQLGEITKHEGKTGIRREIE